MNKLVINLEMYLGLNGTLYWFSIASVKTYHKFSALKQYIFIIWPFCRSEVWHVCYWPKSRCRQGFVPSWRLWERISFQAYSSFWDNWVSCCCRNGSFFSCGYWLAVIPDDALILCLCLPFSNLKATNRRPSAPHTLNLWSLFFLLHHSSANSQRKFSAFKDSCDQTEPT